MRSPSLRTRLVAVAVVLVAFAVVATGVATYAALRGYLVAQVDRQLARTADGFARGLPNRVPSDAPRLPSPPAAAVRLPDGTVFPVVIGFEGTGLQITARQADEVVASADPVALTTADGRRFRAVDRPLLDAAGVTIGPDGEPTELSLPAGTRLIVALPADDLAATLNRLLGLEAIAAAVAIAGTAVLGAAGVRIGLRPLARVTRTAREVAAELSPDGSGLDKRVPAGDPHTEVGQLAEAVNRMLDAVETEYSARYESEQRMRRFLADASHELRTPLTSLRGYAELIRLRGDDGSEADARDALRRIEAEGTRMSRLVDDLLTLARHDRGAAPAREPVDLADVAADAVAGVRAAHPGRRIAVTGPAGPTTVLGDRDELLRVVRNVLTNAATHTSPDGPVTVGTAADGGDVTLTVTDAGPGLPPEQAALVFDRFWRADTARTRTRGGSGLGLSIARALVDGNGGTVDFRSSPERGTTVTLRLPAAPAVHGVPGARAAAGTPAGAAGRAGATGDYDPAGASAS